MRRMTVTISFLGLDGVNAAEGVCNSDDLYENSLGSC